MKTFLLLACRSEWKYCESPAVMFWVSGGSIAMAYSGLQACVRTWMENKKVSIQMAKQGWEFALWFFVPITHFLWVKEQNSNLLFSKSKLLPSLLERLWANRSCHSLKKSYGAKSVRRAIHSWAYKWEKQWTTVKKNGENNGFCWANCSFFESERAICSKKMSESLTSLIVKEQPWANRSCCSFPAGSGSKTLSRVWTICTFV